MLPVDDLVSRLSAQQRAEACDPSSITTAETIWRRRRSNESLENGISLEFPLTFLSLNI
jgi:hypothetical protein